MAGIVRFCPRCKTTHSMKEGCPKRVAFRDARKGRGGRAWRRKRERVFKRDHFLCQIHLRRGVEVTVALHGPNHGVCDHIIPDAEGGSDDESNLQTICQACDQEKTQEESRRGRGVSKS